MGWFVGAELCSARETLRCHKAFREEQSSSPTTHPIKAIWTTPNFTAQKVFYKPSYTAMCSSFLDKNWQDLLKFFSYNFFEKLFCYNAKPPLWKLGQSGGYLYFAQNYSAVLEAVEVLSLSALPRAMAVTASRRVLTWLRGTRPRVSPLSCTRQFSPS